MRRNTARLVWAGLAACGLGGAAAGVGDPTDAGEPGDGGPGGAVVLNPVTSPDGVEWTVLRVGGDMERAVERRGDAYSSGDTRFDTPMPEGYPPPTPPGAIELKRYPLVRRAEVSGDMAPAIGMNIAFYPLFRHIQRRDIAMTSPVEMDYRAWRGEAGGPSEGWTMSFLYRRPGMGAAGAAETGVTVRDVEPVTVLSIGMVGSPGVAQIEAALKSLREWLASQQGWCEDGDARACFYNGPMDPWRTRWAEAQIPVRRTAKPTPEGAAGVADGPVEEAEG